MRSFIRLTYFGILFYVFLRNLSFTFLILRFLYYMFFVAGHSLFLVFSFCITLNLRLVIYFCKLSILV